MDANRNSFDGPWFKTGDMVRQDPEGNFHFVGRSSDTIRRRGENISALEVEDGLERHPDVVECAAMAVPSELTEDEVLAFVIPRFQVPRYESFVDKLPKALTGKVDKPNLRASPLDTKVRDRES
ncbi:AMP-binding protein [Mycolicibacterium sp. YH-1]|uniref:AMP-binding enzyme n=1 Tax=Mycolicibacterium sp. YH-1 TaxID=2908837 RepID=UPI001F4C4F49|nr:AMP-binding protein [Mycolicibacterium sp. YH-1]UNB54462.1 AMP-binding protein [Mycolicibacterium sp. YH-1]